MTNNLNDNYLGSGKFLNRAIKKYGESNFKKEILVLCETEREMNQLEKELISDNWLNLNKNKTYNLKIGGIGGFDHINNSKDYRNSMLGRKHKPETRKILSERAREGFKSGRINPMYNVQSPSKSKHWYNNGIVENMFFEQPTGYRNGRLPKSEETIKKISISLIGNQRNKGKKRKQS